MRRLSVLLVLIVAGTLFQAPASAGSTTYVTFNCTSTKREPARIMFACGDGGYYVDNLDRSSWGVKLAKGRGTFHFNDCKPDCAAGHFHARRGTLVLQYRLPCPHAGRYVFKHAEAIYDRPYGGMQRQSTKLFCPL